MEANSKELLIGDVQRLLELQLFDSAEVIVSMHLSTNTATLEMQELLGDAVFAKKEYKRALSIYRQASHQKKTNQTRTTSCVSSVSTGEEARLKLKESKCLMGMDKLNDAIRELESVPNKLRDVNFNICFGKLCRDVGMKRSAITALKDALLQAPTAVEVIEILVSLGVEAGEITAILDEAHRNSGDGAVFKSIGWLHSLVNALVLKRNFEHDRSMGTFQKLLIACPKNSFLLANMAEVAANDPEQQEAAISLFKQVRRIDSQLTVQRMDVFAKCLFRKEDETELNRLVGELLEACPARATGWLAAALYCGLKSEAEQATAFVEKAIALEPRNTQCYKVKAMLLCAQDALNQAQIAYSQAAVIEKDMETYSGLIETFMALNKLRDAAISAKEAHAAMPRSAVACLLIGRVMAKSPQGGTESIKAFLKATRLSPTNTAVASCLADAYVSQNRHDEAITCLTSVLNKVPSARLRLQLAKTLSAVGRFAEAAENLHVSISLSPRDCTEATQELDSIEAHLRSQNMADAENDQDLLDNAAYGSDGEEIGVDDYGYGDD